MAKPAAKAPPEQVEHYERLLATLPGLERKGAQLPYTSVNGNMFTVLGADGVLAFAYPRGVPAGACRQAIRGPTAR
jgi:hypothetical protein